MNRPFRFAAILSACVVFSTLQAQSISYGVKLGITRSNFSVTDKTSPNFFPYYVISYPEDVSVHPSIGIFAEDRAADFLGVEAEMLYLQKGGCQNYSVPVTTEQFPDGTGEISHIKYEYVLHYLQMGVNIKPKLSLDGSELYATVGPSFDYLLAVSSIRREDVKKSVFGYTVGGGVSFNDLASCPVFLEVRYNGDFSSVFSSWGNFRNTALLINLGVKL